MSTGGGNQLIHVMCTGANATAGHKAFKMSKNMSITGTSKRAEAVKPSKSLADAISVASVWFRGERILFLTDDIWPTSTCSKGLLQGNPEIRIVLSTRRLDIALHGGSQADFGASDSCGRASLAIFLAHELPDTLPSDILLESARSVLLLRAWLPISVVAAGHSIARLIRCPENLTDLCEMHLKNIQAEIYLHPESTFLGNAIRLILPA